MVFRPLWNVRDSWYSSIENLKLVRALGWHFLTRLKSNRKVNPDKTGLKPVSEIFISAAGRVVWLSGFGLIKVFRLIDKDGDAEHWATSILEMNIEERKEFARQAVQIEQYHRGIKQYCLIERSQARRRRPWQNHILLCLRAFLRLESHSFREKVSWHEAKISIIRDAVRAYLTNPRYLLTPTA